MTLEFPVPRLFVLLIECPYLLASLMPCICDLVWNHHFNQKPVKKILSYSSFLPWNNPLDVASSLPSLRKKFPWNFFGGGVLAGVLAR